MFCSECGALIEDGAKFCSFCGHKMLPSSEVSTTGRSGQEIYGFSEELEKRGFHENEEMARKRQSSRARSVSVNDRETNQKLFELYSRLITPIEAIEILNAKIERNKMAIASAVSARSSFGGPVFCMICYTVLCLVLCGGLAPFSGAFVSEPATKVSDISILFFPFRQMIFNAGPKGTYGEYASGAVILASLLCPIWITFLIVFVVRFIINRFYISNGKSVEKDLAAENEKLAEQKSQIVEAVAPYISYVPPDYRTSEKLKFFVNDYNNCKVDTLKEAVLLCDQEQFRLEVVGELKNIRYTLESINTQLNDINSSLRALDVEAGFIAANTLATAIVSAV